MSELIRKISAEEFTKDVENGSGLILVDFWAPWCNPCLRIAPVLEELANEFEGKVTIMKLNVDDHAEVAEKFGITGIPTMILFKDGKVIDRAVGALPREQIREFIQSNL